MIERFDSESQIYLIQCSLCCYILKYNNCYHIISPVLQLSNYYSSTNFQPCDYDNNTCLVGLTEVYKWWDNKSLVSTKKCRWGFL